MMNLDGDCTRLRCNDARRAGKNDLVSLLDNLSNRDEYVLDVWNVPYVSDDYFFDLIFAVDKLDGEIAGAFALHCVFVYSLYVSAGLIGIEVDEIVFVWGHMVRCPTVNDELLRFL